MDRIVPELPPEGTGKKPSTWHHARMRHFAFLGREDRERLFFRAPRPFTVDDRPDRLGVGLGAALYCPATRPHLAVDIARRAAQGVVTVVVCLEDSVPDVELAAAERNTVRQLCEFGESERAAPMISVRVRRAEQISMLVD